MRKITHRYAGLEYNNCNSFKLNFKDAFSLKYLYKLLHEWILDAKYASAEDSEFGEVYYLQRENPKSGKQVTVRWRVRKDPGDPSKLFRYDLDIDINVLGLKEVEVPYKNKKIAMDMGEVEIECRGNLVIDPDQKWEKNKWLKPFKSFFVYKMLKTRYDNHRNEVYNDVNALQNMIKNYFKIPAAGKEVPFSEFWEKRYPE